MKLFPIMLIFILFCSFILYVLPQIFYLGQYSLVITITLLAFVLFGLIAVIKAIED